VRIQRAEKNTVPIRDDRENYIMRTFLMRALHSVFLGFRVIVREDAVWGLS
jgi:hypothetical protein